MKQVFWWAGVCMAALLLSACATPTGATQTATQSPPAPVTSASATPLPLGCADADQPPITSATHIHIQPDHGPVGSQVALVITGAQAHCHLTLNIAVPPALSETQNTPVATPGLSYPVQWITLGADGALTLPYCVCAVIPTWRPMTTRRSPVSPRSQAVRTSETMRLSPTIISSLRWATLAISLPPRSSPSSS